MASEKLTIPLTKTQDRNGKPYLIGRCQFPGTIDLKEGAVFMIFYSEDGCEELQIGVMENRPRKRDADDQNHNVVPTQIRRY